MVCVALCALMELPRPQLLRISAAVMPALAHLALRLDRDVSMQVGNGGACALVYQDKSVLRMAKERVFYNLVFFTI